MCIRDRRRGERKYHVICQPITASHSSRLHECCSWRFCCICWGTGACSTFASLSESPCLSLYLPLRSAISFIAIACALEFSKHRLSFLTETFYLYIRMKMNSINKRGICLSIVIVVCLPRFRHLYLFRSTSFQPRSIYISFSTSVILHSVGHDPSSPSCNDQLWSQALQYIMQLRRPISSLRTLSSLEYSRRDFTSAVVNPSVLVRSIPSH